MDLIALRSRLAQRWWLVAAAALLTLLGAVTAAAESDRHERTVSFVMRPDASVVNDELPGVLEALGSDGPLVQTVVDVLNTDELLARAADGAGVSLDSGYTVETTGRPGSAVIDSTLSGPDEGQVERLAAGFSLVASEYVAASYPAYVLERLSTDTGGGTSPSGPQVAILALLVGLGLGVALVAVELRFEPQLGRFHERFRRARARRSRREGGARPVTPALDRDSGEPRRREAGTGTGPAGPSRRPAGDPRQRAPDRPAALAKAAESGNGASDERSPESKAGSKKADAPSDTAAPSETEPAPRAEASAAEDED